MNGREKNMFVVCEVLSMNYMEIHSCRKLKIKILPLMTEKACGKHKACLLNLSGSVTPLSSVGHRRAGRVVHCLILIKIVCRMANYLYIHPLETL